MSLELTIGANVQPAITAINDMKLNLQKLKDQLSKTTDPSDINRLSTAIVNQKNQIQQALASTNAFANSTFGVSRAARIAHNDLDQAARSLEQISHGSGSAIDGLSGLVFTFERLKGSTGSTKNALAALGEAITSPAGLLIGAAALGPLLIETASKFFEVATGADRAKEEIEALTASLKRSKEELSGFNDDLDRANVTRKLRIDIETPQGLDRTVKDLQSDLQTAQARIINNTAATDEWNKELKELQETSARVSKEQDQLHFGSIQFSRNKVTLEETATKIEKLKAQIDEFTKQTKIAQDDVINIPLKIQLAETDKAREDARKAAEQLKKELEKAGKDGFIFHIQAHPDIPSLKVGDTFFDKLKEDINKKGKEVEVSISPKVQLHLDERGEAVKETQKQLDNLNKIVSDGMAEVAASFAQGIGNIIGGGDISGAFQAVFKAIGGALQALGKAMIAHAIAIQAFKKAFTNPIAEAAAGLGLIIAGSALQAALSRSQKFATGGLVSGPVFAQVGEGPGTSRSNPEVIAPLDKLKGMLGGLALSGYGLQFTSVLKGSDIVLAVNRTNRTQGRGG